MLRVLTAPLGKSTCGVRRARLPKAAHSLLHRDVERASIAIYESDIAVDGPACWQVRRLDDNGNEFEMAIVTPHCQAEALAVAFEARGHKQTYWAEPLDTRSSIC